MCHELFSKHVDKNIIVFCDSGAQFLANYLEKNCYGNKQERFEFDLFAKSKRTEKEEKSREQECRIWRLVY